MKSTEERVLEMRAAGFSAPTIHKHLREQLHDVKLSEVKEILKIKVKPTKKPPMKKYYYRVNERAFTGRTTEELKARYYKTCMLLNSGMTRREAAEELGITRNALDGSIGVHIIRREKN